jgi:hypothetical protein
MSNYSEVNNPESSGEIIVYDNYKISLNKYPRINTNKEKTDIINYVIKKWIFWSRCKTTPRKIRFRC